MTKADLIEGLANKLGLNKGEAERAVNVVLDDIINALKQGERVNISGFGTFSASIRHARTGRNPKHRAKKNKVKRDVPRACVRDFDGWVKRGGAADARTLERTAAAVSGSAHVQRHRTWAQASKSRRKRPKFYHRNHSGKAAEKRFS